jgi:hypothetical protein
MEVAVAPSRRLVIPAAAGQAPRPPFAEAFFRSAPAARRLAFLLALGGTEVDEHAAIATFGLLDL